MPLKISTKEIPIPLTPQASAVDDIALLSPSSSDLQNIFWADITEELQRYIVRLSLEGDIRNQLPQRAKLSCVNHQFFDGIMGSGDIKNYTFHNDFLTFEEIAEKRSATALRTALQHGLVLENEFHFGRLYFAAKQYQKTYGKICDNFLQICYQVGKETKWQAYWHDAALLATTNLLIENEKVVLQEIYQFDLINANSDAQLMFAILHGDDPTIKRLVDERSIEDPNKTYKLCDGTFTTPLLYLCRTEVENKKCLVELLKHQKINVLLNDPQFPERKSPALCYAMTLKNSTYYTDLLLGDDENNALLYTKMDVFGYTDFNFNLNVNDDDSLDFNGRYKMSAPMIAIHFLKSDKDDKKIIDCLGILLAKDKEKFFFIM